VQLDPEGEVDDGLPGFRQQLSQPRSCFVAIDLASGYRQGRVFPFWSVGFWLKAVQAEEHDACAECGPLIAIDEWMISAQFLL